MEVRSRHPRARHANGFTSEVYSGITSGSYAEQGADAGLSVIRQNRCLEVE